VPGLEEAGYLTNENVFWLTELPRRLAVIGAGPIGCEMAQAFALLGSRVTLMDVAPQIMPREDPDAAAIVERQLVAAGVALELGVTLRDARQANGAVHVTFDRTRTGGPEGPAVAASDAVLVATGRSANIEELDLAAAGVEHDRAGVVVNDRLQTTNPRIFAAGDVCSRFKFTHAADAMARVVIQNALFFGRKHVSALVIPWCTYTFPEVAHVGLSADEAKQRGAATLTIPLAEIDRAVVDEEVEGFIRVHHVKGHPIGCTVVAAHAGELIGLMSYVLRTGGTLSDLSSTVFPYPTVAEGFRKAGDAYRRGMLTPRVRGWLQRYFAAIR
jgi:pyruvate/2-oxoglutarate dehydrogenase complex dihydrolipoamide dehydrogenase (E3) component